MRLVSLLAALALGLAACAPTAHSPTRLATGTVPPIYQARTDTGPNGEVVDIPAVRAAYLTQRNQRQRVAYNGPEAPGTVVVDPYARVLYHVMENGEAMRFGVAVGRAGKGFSGDAVISVKKRWPSWTPTQNMIRTEPELYGQFAGGLKGGLDNPLGSRALYLYRNGRDTYYRIHGTMDPSSIGKATSAGCIRLFNQDIMDLFDETDLGARVKVRSQAESVRREGPMIETPEGYVVPASEAAQAQLPAATTTAAAPGFTSPVESAVPSR
ncbi:L,D-transpeptidase [Paracoccus sp. R12_1]|uniref:L,D-transpeptidase n=1 Tax=unclassified Paracoccus (in: a-proteobacteria) TaxID=2688777 RepID=UPI001ADB9845|nr:MULTISPECIES: L,D-transpeptidase [unclassified Paracoccus (in: a-proteobacteria)]MBO9455292.1 L,D-transpeptidase [Paracoccus sp. R12_2]MBO9488189.1 L,D-transpeptidase [Paracoccus sp. R12_1]